jgi:phospholipase C
VIRRGTGGALALTGLGSAAAAIEALAGAPQTGRLRDIEHVVILIQENRSFDHYFGSYRGVRGFSDPHALRHGGVFRQPGYPAPGHGGHLDPFHLDTSAGRGECVADPTHDWGPQHRSWNGGRMDGFVREHLAADGPQDGAITMGYYNRRDLAFYYALADAFTICDGYHCSVLGPSYPNQAYAVSATIDPAGRHGGPLVGPASAKAFSWETMPERLSAHGIDWRVYTSPDNYLPGQVGDPPFQFFRQYTERADLAERAFAHSFPGDFQSDARAGNLPAVSWVYAPVTWSEHPPAPIGWGEAATDLVLSAIWQNPDAWARTAVFVTWDENGGFFDHVPPPVAPSGTPGEHLTVSSLPADCQGVRGPIGLGFRVPMLVVSPFSRGGFVCSDVFDHSSMLRFLEARFGAAVPNLSEWRRHHTGDLTSAFNFAGPRRSIPRLPPTSFSDESVTGGGCEVDVIGAETGTAPSGHYPVPPNHRPGQERGRPRRPSGPVHPRRHLRPQQNQSQGRPRRH